MSRTYLFILGATAGAVATLFFTSNKGQQIIQDLVYRYDDKISQLSDTLKGKVDSIILLKMG
jgi:gas vesicle protein